MLYYTLIILTTSEIADNSLVEKTKKYFIGVCVILYSQELPTTLLGSHVSHLLNKKKHTSCPDHNLITNRRRCWKAMHQWSIKGSPVTDTNWHCHLALIIQWSSSLTFKRWPVVLAQAPLVDSCLFYFPSSSPALAFVSVGLEGECGSCACRHFQMG